MNRYKIYFKPSVKKDLRKIPKATVKKIRLEISNLSENPFPFQSKKLVGEEDTFRLRIGFYRVIYQVENKKLIILVIKVAHRKEVYGR